MKRLDRICRNNKQNIFFFYFICHFLRFRNNIKNNIHGVDKHYKIYDKKSKIYDSF